MAMQNPVIWFEIPARDIERAKRFYEVVFGIELSLQAFGESVMVWFPMEMNALGASGALVMGEGYVPSQQGTLIYFSVASIDETLARIEASGGKVLVPKTDIGEFGLFAHFEDSEGNRVGLHTSTPMP